MTYVISIVTLLVGFAVMLYGLLAPLEPAPKIMFQAVGIVLFWVTLVGMTAASEIRRLRTEVRALKDRLPDPVGKDAGGEEAD
ncbi:MAG: hypothetical protein ACOCWV_03380 [Planctomycetota bacterium]